MKSLLRRHWLYLLNVVILSFLGISNANADITTVFENELSISQKQDVEDLLIISSSTINLAKMFEVGFSNTSRGGLLDLPYGTPFENCTSEMLRSEKNFIDFQQPRIKNYVLTHSSQQVAIEKALFTPALNRFIQSSFLAGFTTSTDELSNDQVKQEKLLLQSQLSKDLKLPKALDNFFYDKKYKDLRYLLLIESPTLMVKDYSNWSMQQCELKL